MVWFKIEFVHLPGDAMYCNEHVLHHGVEALCSPCAACSSSMCQNEDHYNNHNSSTCSRNICTRPQ